MIELRGVGKDFVDETGATVAALAAVSLEVRAGETLCLIGTSGSGKTTLLKLINRLIEPSRGVVLVEGQDVSAVDVIALRRRMGYVIQAGGLFPHLSIGDNVGLLCELEGWDPKRMRERIHELLELVHLPADEFAHRRPGQLSGGQRQRVGVARALALDPPIVLMDEPFGALDPITRGQTREDFADLKVRLGKTVVFVTHDMSEAFAVGDRVGLLDGGQLVQVGTAEDFRDRPASEFVTRFLEAHFDA